MKVNWRQRLGKSHTCQGGNLLTSQSPGCGAVLVHDWCVNLALWKHDLKHSLSSHLCKDPTFKYGKSLSEVLGLPFNDSSSHSHHITGCHRERIAPVLVQKNGKGTIGQKPKYLFFSEPVWKAFDRSLSLELPTSCGAFSLPSSSSLHCPSGFPNNA